MKLFGLLSLSLLMSCATLTAKPKGKIEPGYINGEGLVGKSAKNIRDHLTRSDTMGFSNYQIEATLFTPALIEAEEKELGKQNHESEETIKLAITKKKSALTDRETCFSVHISVSNATLEAAQPKNWVIKIKSASGVYEALTISNTSSTPKYSVSSYGSGATTEWYDTTIACTKKKVPTGSPIELVFIPQIIADHMKGEIKLIWE